MLLLSLSATAYGGRYSGGVLDLPGPPLDENFEGAQLPPSLQESPLDADYSPKIASVLSNPLRNGMHAHLHQAGVRHSPHFQCL